ncbi:MAG TPA: M20/M25/M40 family metallo-hydrolase, partial [Vicinamibacteria bacterium]
MKLASVRESVVSLRDELCDLASDLVQRKSVTGTEDDIQQALASRLSDWGLQIDLWRIEESLRDHPAFCDDGEPVTRLNLVARWGEPDANRPASLILNGHVDVVPEGERERWSSDPYSGAIRDGRLHGRG